MKKYSLIINVENFITRVAIVQGGNIEYFFVHKRDFDAGVGNIYKGRVEKVISSLNAAFVNIGSTKSGFLPFLKEDALYLKDDVDKDDVEVSKKGIKNGDEIMVQITKPHSETKGMKLTTKISLPGRFLILLPLSTQRAISRKITDKEERERLMNIAGANIKPDMGFILRTAAYGKNRRYIEREIKILLGQWNKIRRYNKSGRCPSVLWEDDPVFIRVMREHVNDDFCEIIVDNPTVYRRIKKYTGLFLPEMKDKISLHRSESPLFEKYNLESTVESFFTNKIYLPSRGHILIEEAETLNAIDVNTGGGSGRDTLRKTIFNTNMEAAREIPRQIRVRNLSGLIIVDLIDMKDHKQRKRVFKEFNKNLEIDKANIEILSISKLGLVEMSREKTDFKLSDVLLEKCECCQGSGYTRRVELTALKLKNSVMQNISSGTGKNMNIEVSPDLYDFLSSEDKRFIGYLKRRNIALRSENRLGKNDFKIYS